MCIRDRCDWTDLALTRTVIKRREKANQNLERETVHIDNLFLWTADARNISRFSPCQPVMCLQTHSILTPTVIKTRDDGKEINQNPKKGSNPRSNSLLQWTADSRNICRSSTCQSVRCLPVEESAIKMGHTLFSHLLSSKRNRKLIRMLKGK